MSLLDEPCVIAEVRGTAQWPREAKRVDLTTSAALLRGPADENRSPLALNADVSLYLLYCSFDLKTVVPNSAPVSKQQWHI